MCSIEEAWAGQTFNGYTVQSQADLRRKYLPISDNMLNRNNEFLVSRKEPVSRMENQGMNTKMNRSSQLSHKQQSPLNINTNNIDNSMMNLSFSENTMPVNNYGGLEPRPHYMSIYDNAELNNPMPAQQQRNNFGDINQAFQVNPIVETFMTNNNLNPLINENTKDDQLVLYKKFNSSNSNNQITSNNENSLKNDNQDLLELQKSLKNILVRLENVEKELENSSSRNMYDIILYILIGMLLSFILYTLLRK